MTIEKFISELRKTPRNWFFQTMRGSKEIRCTLENKRIEYCPITAVYSLLSGDVSLSSQNRVLTTKPNHMVAAKKLGLSEDLMDKIVRASDYPLYLLQSGDDEDVVLVRRRLLGAVGLTE